MKLTKFDIGAEVISILTKGMYPDPRDAVREYIQNAVDAKAKNVSVSVRQSSVVVEDDGTGMDYDTLRKALRIGISDKRPGKDVGFMGIGIYSAFHLCDTLTIYTRKEGKLPQMLQMNFAVMRSVLKNQRDKRLNNEIDGDQLIDLQTLLQTNIFLPEEKSLPEDEYPVSHGTRVEIVGLDPILDELINQFDTLSAYLRDVVPLHFDANNFDWGGEIESKIQTLCDEHNAHFELVDLKLNVNGRTEKLYRPYRNSIFHNSKSQEPRYRELKKNGMLLGIAWGCLNSERKIISDENYRGFLLKKQGFTIGSRKSITHFFGSNKFFDRYAGEVIVVHPDILPNAARNGLEYSPLKTWFDELMANNVAKYFNEEANQYQETSIAEELLLKLNSLLKVVITKFSPYEDNPDNLVALTTEINSNIKSKFSRNGKVTRSEKKAEFQKLLKDAEGVEKDIRDRLNFLVSNRQQNLTKQSSKSIAVAQQLKEYTSSEVIEKFESLVLLLASIGIDYSDIMKEVLSLLDEKFIQAKAQNKAQYYRLLSELKEDIENLEF